RELVLGVLRTPEITRSGTEVASLVTVPERAPRAARSGERGGEAGEEVRHVGDVALDEPASLVVVRDRHGLREVDDDRPSRGEEDVVRREVAVDPAGDEHLLDLAEEDGVD